ncbi:MAG: hypothetical protein QOD94_2021 [Alphaproteobacteria bacterium]|jgi:hypothetical protein|nr:hypothetical protein [Alphaproteobacteria bacterium]
MAAEEAVARIALKYVGGDADENLIDLLSLGQSLQGAARILRSSGHFALTHQYERQVSLLQVRVLATPAVPGSYDLMNLVMPIGSVLPFMADPAMKLVPEVAKYVVSRVLGKLRGKPHMHVLLDKVLEENAATRRDAFDLARHALDKMAEASRPAVKQMAAPIGVTCETVQLSGPTDEPVIIDQADKDALEDEDDTIKPEDTFRVYLSEVDMKSASCKLSLDQANPLNDRFTANISDVSIKKPDNEYTASMGKWITVRARAIYRADQLHRLIIESVVK